MPFLHSCMTLGLYGRTLKAGLTNVTLAEAVRNARAKRAYYETRGWDVKKGVPSREKLDEMDLKNAAKDLEKRGVLLKLYVKNARM